MESQPFDIVEDIFYIFVVLFAWVGVIEAQVANAIVVLSNAKVHTNGLGMADMQITIGLWGKTGLDATGILAVGQVFLHNLLYET